MYIWDPNKAQIMALLTENVALSLESGEIAHISEMKDIPAVGSLFFILDCYKGRILGPFIVSSPQYHMENPHQFYRKERGISKVFLTPCPWVFEFLPHPELLEPNRGVSWQYISEQIDVPHTWRSIIREVRFSESQLNAMANILFEASRLNGCPEYAKDYSSDTDLGDDDLLPEDFYLESPNGAIYGDDGSPLNDAADIEFFFLGDHNAAETNQRQY